jgi:hypothetical protein
MRNHLFQGVSSYQTTEESDLQIITTLPQTCPIGFLGEPFRIWCPSDFTSQAMLIDPDSSTDEE